MLALLASPLLTAQTTPEENVSVDFTTLNWDTKVIQDIQFETDNKVESISIYNRGLSIPKHYHGPATLTFFREQTKPDTGETVRVPVAQTKLTSDTREVLLVFQPANDQSREYYHIYPVKRDREIFPRGSYQVFNFSDYTISGKIEDNMFKLEKQSSTIIKLPLQKTTTIEVKFARTSGEAWKMAYSSLWGHKAGDRVNIFIFNSGNPVSPIEIRRYKEFLPAPDTNKTSSI